MFHALLLALALTGCVLVDAPTLDARLDPDGDGVPHPEDCDSSDGSVFPGADEACDGVDQDCDGEVDEGLGGTWYADTDGDGYGDLASPVVVCEARTGVVENAGDCDDGTASVHPGAAETDCEDPIDYNCDGSVGGDDGDQDGAVACDDCDDADDARFPGASEVCDEIDQDCDDEVDEDAIDAGTWFADADEDTYGDPAVSVAACDAPDGYVADDTDCDDGEGAFHPGATEVCDEADVDEDCDGATGESGSVGEATWYADADGDGYGDPTTSTTSCDAPSGYVAAGDDPDDTDMANPNPFAHPVASLAGDGYWSCTQGSLGPGGLSGSDKSVAAWVRIGSGEAAGVVIDNDPGGYTEGVEAGFLVGISSGQPYWLYSDDGSSTGGAAHSTSTSALADGDWHLLEAVCHHLESGTVTFYVDGSETDTVAATWCNGNNHSRDFQVGGRVVLGVAEGLFAGDIAELGVWYARPSLDTTPGVSLDDTSALVLFEPDGSGGLVDVTGNGNACAWVDVP